MNIEESIGYLKLKIKNDNLTIQGMFGDIYEEIQKDNKAIETLLTAYEKEKEEHKKECHNCDEYTAKLGKLEVENEMLKLELEKEKEKNKKINKYIEDRAKIGKDIQTFINEDYVEQEYISKDKIKAKMKEKEWSLENYDCDESDYKQSQAIGAWSVLQSLLKEE